MGGEYMASTSTPTRSTWRKKEKEDLFDKAMKGEWEEVLGIYRKHQEAPTTRITRAGDTALHIAVSDNQEVKVGQLIKSITSNERRRKALEIQNEQGYTPLHFAASMGSVSMCELIAGIDPSLVGIRNSEGETPYFVAALQGKKEAFLCLHRICGSSAEQYTGRSDGDTILHCAISGEYFDLAFQITHLYKGLIDRVNEQGLSPFHLLSSRPSAFRSGSNIQRFSKIIYYCTFIDVLQVETSEPQSKDKEKSKGKKKMNGQKSYPGNYTTCINFFQLFLDMIRVATACGHKKNQKQPDSEDPEGAEHKGDQCCTTSKKENIRGLLIARLRMPFMIAIFKGATSKSKAEKEHENKTEEENHGGAVYQGPQIFPANYGTCFEFIKLVSKAIMVVLGVGSTRIKRIRDKKRKHRWAVQVMDEFLRQTKMYESDPATGTHPDLKEQTEDETKPYDILDGGSVTVANVSAETKGSHGNGQKEEGATQDRGRDSPQDAALATVSAEATGSDGNDKNEKAKEENRGKPKRETPILLAAKYGVTEMVAAILERFPVAIHDVDAEKKNVVLLAVENRQPHVYRLLLARRILRDSVFRKVDINGNSALHLAAKLGDSKPWLIPGEALQMQWEIKWYEYVKDSMPPHFFPRSNKDGKTAKELFSESHKTLVKEGGEWLNNTSQSCSVVAALIATVAFATSSTVPGGVKQDSGTPTLENQPAFDIFAITSLIALCCSITAVVMFLAILTSRHQERDFHKDLPRKLLIGLTSLFVSIASMLVSFCAGHFFELKDKLKYAAFPVYAVTCLPVTFFAAAQFPLYFDLLWATSKKVPRRSFKAASL